VHQGQPQYAARVSDRHYASRNTVQAYKVRPKTGLCFKSLLANTPSCIGCIGYTAVEMRWYTNLVTLIGVRTNGALHVTTFLCIRPEKKYCTEIIHH